MLEWFKCPDQELIPVKECLTKCRMGDRCLTLPTLTMIGTEREQVMKWTCPNCKEVVVGGTVKRT